jgi:hypothetical protein
MYESECKNQCMRRNVKIDVWGGMWKLMYGGNVKINV